MSKDVYRMRVIYEKMGISKYISGKNLLRHIERCLRRTNLPLKYTEGFNPHPKLSFGPPLPVYIEGENEIMDIYFNEKINENEFLRNINQFLVEGVLFKDCFWIPLETHSLGVITLMAVYKIEKDELDLEKLKDIGEVKESGSFFEVIIKINGFSHKKLFEIVGNQKRIIRKIIYESNYNR